MTIKINDIASGSSGNCYHLTGDGVTPLLLECGIRYLLIMEGIGYDLGSLGGCIVTHEHKDHSKSVEKLIHLGIDCYMSKGTADAIGVDYGVKIVIPEKLFKIGSWTIYPFKTAHSTHEMPVAESLGFFMRTGDDRLLFVTDSAYIKPKFDNLTYIMIECNYQESILRENISSKSIDIRLAKRIRKSHFSLENVIQFLRSNDISKVREIWLLHLSNKNSNEKEIIDTIIGETGKIVRVAG